MSPRHCVHASSCARGRIGRLAAVILRLVIVALPLLGAAESQAAIPKTPPPLQYRDFTEAWSSPGATSIARQLREVNPAWGITAAELDQLANEWCSPFTPNAIERLMNAVWGVDTRALPALTQLVVALRASCYQRRMYSSAEIDYWTHVTAGNLMELVRYNVIRQYAQSSVNWRRPAPPVPQRVASSLRPVSSGACRVVTDLASSWIARKALKGPWGLVALGGISIAKVSCPTLLNAVLTRVLR